MEIKNNLAIQSQKGPKNVRYLAELDSSIELIPSDCLKQEWRIKKSDFGGSETASEISENTNTQYSALENYEKYKKHHFRSKSTKNKLKKNDPSDTKIFALLYNSSAASLDAEIEEVKDEIDTEKLSINIKSLLEQKKKKNHSRDKFIQYKKKKEALRRRKFHAIDKHKVLQNELEKYTHIVVNPKGAITDGSTVEYSNYGVKDRIRYHFKNKSIFYKFKNRHLFPKDMYTAQVRKAYNETLMKVDICNELNTHGGKIMLKYESEKDRCQKTPESQNSPHIKPPVLKKNLDLINPIMITTKRRDSEGDKEQRSSKIARKSRIHREMILRSNAYNNRKVHAFSSKNYYKSLSQFSPFKRENQAMNTMYRKRASRHMRMENKSHSKRVSPDNDYALQPQKTFDLRSSNQTQEIPLPQLSPPRDAEDEAMMNLTSRYKFNLKPAVETVQKVGDEETRNKALDNFKMANSSIKNSLEKKKSPPEEISKDTINDKLKESLMHISQLNSKHSGRYNPHYQRMSRNGKAGFRLNSVNVKKLNTIVVHELPPINSTKRNRQLNKSNQRQIYNLAKQCDEFLKEDSKFIKDLQLDRAISNIKLSDFLKNVSIIQDLDTAKPSAMKLLFDYQMSSKIQDVIRENDVIHEYRSGIIDPSRYVARVEKNINYRIQMRNKVRGRANLK
ncbi:unnamed protein product [Moneuplotes crassus]|uniref:Uncharacterized protein n=1 Tax=Euplotes crassus TaxID=5936 RepID=A0AAD2DCP3_EUPCR|nr:unnamed protein product [Moneuplotes crassus]